MKRTLTYLLLPLMLLGFTCCGGQRAAEAQFGAADAVLESSPDSALQLLRAIDTATFRTERQRMRWRLLTARAQLLSDEERLDEAFTAPLYAYYESHGPKEQQAVAAYIHAKACQNAGKLDEAVKAYTRAAICAEACPDDREIMLLLGAVCHTLGALHLEQGYNVEAEEAFRKAVAIGARYGDPESEGYARFMLSAALCTQKRFDEAIEALAPLVEARDTIRFRYFAQQITLQNLLYHAYADDWSTERLLAERARIDLGAIDSAPLSYGRASTDDSQRTFYDIASTILFAKIGQLDSARYYADRVLARTTVYHQGNLDTYRIAAGIYHGQGDDATAYAHAWRYIEMQDSLEAANRDALSVQLERQFRAENAAALRETRLRYDVWIALLVCLLLALLAVGLVGAYRRKLRQRDERIGEYLALIDSYRESQDSLTSRLDASDSREAALKELLKGRFAHIRDIAATCYTYGEGARLSEKMRELALSPAMLADVVRMADLYNEGAVSRLREAFPEWTKRNHDFAALVIAGFSPQEICVMLGMTPNGVYTLKSKLKRRIAESDIAAREELLRFFA